MATANSVTFQADKDSLFASAIQIIQGAGYIISETNDAARKLIYYADSPVMGALKERFEVTISISGASQTTATTAMFTMRVVGLAYDHGFMGQGVAENHKFENDVINFVLNELKKQYQVDTTTTTISNAPGAGGQKTGCLVMLGFLGLLAAGSGCGFLMLLAALLH